MKKLKWFIFIMTFFVSFISFYQDVNAVETQNIANVVIFTKFKGSQDDSFSEESNFNYIKKVYNQNIISGKDISFKNYIKTISEDKVNVENYFPQEVNNKIITYELSNTSDYYISSDSIVREVIEAINNSKINFNITAKLDNVNSGILDNLIIVVEGSSSDRGNIIYPHKANYSGSEKIKQLNVSNYNIYPSNSLINQGVGLIAHEFLHVLGFPDLYYSCGCGEPVGFWDIMSKADVQYPVSYLRAKKGWIKTNYITESGNYTLTAVSEKGEDNKVYIIKTPLKESEYIVLEYRRKGSYMDFEYRVPYSGLLMYRVNDKIEEKSNIDTKNYIYVYRLGVTNLEQEGFSNISGVDADKNVALSPDKNKTEYGNTDLSKGYLDNTLYYSDGSNSGIKISNVKFINDNKQINFDVEFANYSDAGLWEDLGVLTNEDYTKPLLYTDELEKITYASYTEKENLTQNAVVKKYDSNKKQWIQVGNTISKMEASNVIKYKDNLYLACKDLSNGYISYYKLIGSTWNKIGTDNVPASNVKLVSSKNTVYSVYETTISGLATKLTIKDILNKKVIFEKQAQNFGNASVYEYEDKIFVAFSDFFGTNKKGMIQSYDLNKKTWKNEVTSNIDSTNIHIIKEYNNKLYAFIGEGGNIPNLYIYDGNKWVERKIGLMEKYLDVSLNIINDKVYISYIDQKNNKLNVILVDDNNISDYNDKLGNEYEELNVIVNDGYLYATAKVKNSNIVVSKRTKVDEEEILISSISLNKTKLELQNGKSYKLKASISPSNTTQSKKLIWESNNEDIVTVTNSGEILAKEIGTAIITVKTEDGNHIAKCEVNVIEGGTSIEYATHVQNVGWQNYVSDGKMSGTSGRSLRLEGIKIKVNSNYTGDILYSTHVQDYGWQPYVKNDEISGTVGKSKRLEAIKIKLTGELAEHYDVYYRVHVQNIGWQSFVKNGELAGTSGRSLRLEAIEIKLVEKSNQDESSISYKTHIQNIGWQNYVSDGKMSGTSGKSLRLEGIKIKVNSNYTGDILYSTHVQDYGWQPYVKNDEVSGTVGKSKRLEAIKIKLTGELAEHYDVYYRVHVQNIGWQPFVKNGELAGTTGRSLRLEAIEIKLVEKSNTN